jgi:hypothetical protein
MSSMVVAGMMVSGAAVAQDKPVTVPAADAVKAVWDFQANGQGKGIVLGDSWLCLEVQTKGDNVGQCVEGKGIPSEGVKAGGTVNLVQAYLIPKGDQPENVTVQVKIGETVRETKDVKMPKGAFNRHLTWTGVTLKKPGAYTLTVMNGDAAMKSLTVTAIKE